VAEIQSDAKILEDSDSALHDAAAADTTEENVEFAKIDDLKAENTVAETTPAPAAAPAPAAEDDDVPTEFKGKSKKEIAKMYQDAHKLIGRQGMELGELRGKVDLAVRLASEGLRRAPTAPVPPAQPAQPVAEEVDESAFFNKPSEAIARAIANNPVIKEIQRSLGQTAASQAAARAQANTERFQQMHPDSAEILANPEFRKWVSGSRVRQALLQRADKHFDFEAGDEVFSTWKALRGVKQPAAAPAPAAPAAPAAADVSAAAATLAAARKAKQDAQGKAASVPTGGASSAGKPSGGKKIYRRADIVRLMVEDQDRYEALSDEIRIAYEEGRVR
jgi:hypothetical protein